MYNTIETLLRLTREMQQRYQAAKSGKHFTFNEDVVPFVSQIDDLLIQLDSLAEQIVALPYMNKVKYERLKENLESISVECHYSNTSRKLFIEKVKSVTYDLNYIKESERQYG